MGTFWSRAWATVFRIVWWLTIGLGVALLALSPTVAFAAAATSHASGAPTATLSARTLDFGLQPLGQTRSLAVTLTNTGDGDLHLRALGNPSGNFLLLRTCPVPSTLAPGADCVVLVGFSPSVFGAQQASLSFVDDALGDQTVTITGSGTGSVLVADVSRIDFGMVYLGDADTRAVHLWNRGMSDLVVTGIAVSGPGLAEASDCQAAPVAPGESCAVMVRFAPSAATTLATALTVDSNALGGTLVLPVTGSAAERMMAMRADPPSFGNTPVGTYTERPFTITNAGTEDLLIGVVTLVDTTGDFSLVGQDCLAHPIAPRRACTITIRYKPMRVASESASLVIRSNAPGAVTTYSISGSGVPLPMPNARASTQQNVADSVGGRLRLLIPVVAETSYLSLVCLLVSIVIWLRGRQRRMAVAQAERILRPTLEPVATPDLTSAPEPEPAGSAAVAPV